jgi:hypothetical protein
LENSWTFSKTFSIKDRNLSILGKLWAVHYPYAHPAQFVPTRRPGIRRLSASQHSVVLFDGIICQFSLRFSGRVKFPNCFRTSVFSASASVSPNFSPQRFSTSSPCFRTSVFSASAPLFPNFSPQRFSISVSELQSSALQHQWSVSPNFSPQRFSISVSELQSSALQHR